MGDVEVTIIVACYNPNWEKLKKTIVSLVKQKDLTTQIIVSDDGSKENHFEQLCQLFYLYNYKNFILLDAHENQGTCLNIKKGIDKSCGEFIKIITPGDYLFSDSCLSEWYNFNKKNNIRVSFGDAVYYSETDKGEVKFLSCLAAPQFVELYNLERYSQKKVLLDYIFLNDAVIGANFLVESDTLRRYINSIAGKIKYAEDMVFRMMLCDGIEIIHFPYEAIWYEYGTGISTSGSLKWKQIIYNEKQVSNKLIINSLVKKKSLNSKRLVVGIKTISKRKYAMLKYLVFPELILMKISKDHKCRQTDTNYELEQFINITQDSMEAINASN